MTTQRSRAWVFTLNNPTSDDVVRLSECGAAYGVYGRETGDEGTHHLQGYLYFKSARTLISLKKKLPRAHLEPRKGSHEQARDYCIKDGDFEEWGTPPLTQKQKGDAGASVYREAWDLAKQGKIEEIDETLRLKYYSTLKRIARDYMVSPPDLDFFEGWWYYGPSGTGKSRKARQDNPGAYIKNVNKWWDGYQGQDVVIIDEWSPSHSMLAYHLKIWVDHYAFNAEVKGGSMMIRPKKIVITSNYSLRECFSEDQDYLPLARRFEEVCFGHRGGYVTDFGMELSQ